MRLTKPLFWLIVVLWFAAGTWWYAGCSKCSTCTSEQAILPATATTTSATPGFTVTDSSWSLSSNDNIRFSKSGFTPVLSHNLKLLIDSTGVYGTLLKSKQIVITGYYHSGETNNSSFPDLGLARAEEIKKMLLQKGNHPGNIITQSQLSDELIFSPADTLVGGIVIAFHQLAEPVVSDLFAPRTVYFNTGKNSFRPNAELLNYLASAKDYLSKHPDKKLMVTGYTDNKGDADKNLQLSVNRAEFIKAELVKKGIPATSIEASGKGINDPAADNNTEEGRTKNRRVVIGIQ